MSIRTLNNSGFTNTNVSSKGFPAGFTPVTEPWVRNPSWPSLPTVVSTDETLVGLYAVWPGDGSGNGGNFFACTASGAYTIDYGDGTVTNYSSGAQANYEFNYNNSALDGTNAPVTLTDSGDLVTRTAHGYSDGMRVQFYNIVTTTGLTQAQYYYVINSTANTFQVSETVGGSAVALTNDGTATLLPYKVAIVTLTPQSGQNLTALNLFVRNTTTGLSRYATGWLDISISSPNFFGSSLVISGSSTAIVVHSLLEQVNIVNLGGTTAMISMFYNCYALQSVQLFNTASVTAMNNMFSSCYSLQTVPLFNTASAVNMSNMFYYCSSLQSVPLFNTASVTNMSNMFQYCYSLQTVPLFNTASVTNMTYMFLGCYSLKSVPLFNTASVTNMSTMFQSCYSLKSVPLFNTASVTTMSYMFNGCYSLQTVPLFNTASVTNMSTMFRDCAFLYSVPLFNTASVTTMNSMFYNCYSLQSVPLFNTASVTDISYMFYACYSLQTVPLFNTASVTTINGMFQSCYSLQSVPLFDTSSVTNISYMFSGCSSLQSVPALDVSAVTSSANLTNMFSTCRNLARIEASQFKYTFTVTNCKLSSAALDEIYTNLPTVTGQTITVTSNYGTTGDDPTIATAKGWTVTG